MKDDYEEFQNYLSNAGILSLLLTMMKLQSSRPSRSCHAEGLKYRALVKVKVDNT